MCVEAFGLGASRASRNRWRGWGGPAAAVWLTALFSCADLGDPSGSPDDAAIEDPDAAPTEPDAASSPPDASPDEELCDPPIARFAVSPAAGTAATELTFDASETDVDGAAEVDFAWRFGDEADFESAGAVVQRTLTTPGVHAVTLRAEACGWVDHTVGFVVVAPDDELLVVTTSEDSSDPGDGEVSLRGAVDTANATEGATVITFAGPMTIELAENLQINGDDTAIVGMPGVVIDGGLGATDCIESFADRTTLLWLEVTRCANDGIKLRGDHARVASSTIHGNQDDGIEVRGLGAEIGPHNHLVGNGGDGVEVESRDDREQGDDDVVVIHENRIVQNARAGVAVKGDGLRAAEVVVRENVIAANARSGIALESGSGAAIVWHNTLARNLRHGIDVQEVDVSGHDVRNNIFAENLEAGIEGGATVEVVDHNLWDANLGGDCNGCETGPSAVLAPPQFLDADSGDFRLGRQSPALDAGEDLGLNRNGPAPGSFSGSAPDIGAEESPAGWAAAASAGSRAN